MRTAPRDRWLSINYAVTIFTSAFLLFQIQPLISKYILPWFGGSPAVWTTCLLFFQTLLFAGYAYAHFSHRRLAPRQQVLLHGGLILLAVALVGVLPGDRWQPRGEYNPVAQILLILFVSVGLPYFVLASTGPLLQAWFARSFPGRAPYRLYALSNLGSMLALLSYPFFFEPMFALPWQAHLWSIGFIAYAIFCGYAAWRLWKLNPPAEIETPRLKKQQPVAEPSRMQRLLWLAWPALASVVLMATTNHVSTDIAVMPFLWVAPLALYLLTFIIAFDRPGWYRPVLVAVITLLAIYGTAMLHNTGIGTVDSTECGTAGWLYNSIADAVAPANPDSESSVRVFHVSPAEFLVVNFAAMFGICLLCHGELVRQRPAPQHLTSYYLMIAAGGALGGAFVTLLAPQIFVAYLEWQLSLVVAALIAIGLILQSFVRFALQEDDLKERPSRYATVPAVGLAAFLAIAIVLLDLTEFLPPSSVNVKHRVRNFFGTLAINDRNPERPFYHGYVLRHGVITHGAQYSHETRHREATTYYSPASGVGRTIEYFLTRPDRKPMKIGGVGLGTGTLATFPEKGDAITFYEINPAVIELTESGDWFTFMKDCRQRGATCQVKLGDARLTLARELEQDEPQEYDVLVLDAFSGDSVPAHLLTVEAFEIYLAHLAGALTTDPPSGEPASQELASREAGAIAVHISNRYVDLKPVVQATADRFKLLSIYIENEEDTEKAIYSSDWIILTHNKSLARELTKYAAPQPDGPQKSVLWTDDHSSLFDVLK